MNAKVARKSISEPAADFRAVEFSPRHQARDEACQGRLNLVEGLVQLIAGERDSATVHLARWTKGRTEVRAWPDYEPAFFRFDPRIGVVPKPWRHAAFEQSKPIPPTFESAATRWMDLRVSIKCGESTGQ